MSDDHDRPLQIDPSLLKLIVKSITSLASTLTATQDVIYSLSVEAIGSEGSTEGIIALPKEVLEPLRLSVERLGETIQDVSKLEELLTKSLNKEPADNE